MNKAAVSIILTIFLPLFSCGGIGSGSDSDSVLSADTVPADEDNSSYDLTGWALSRADSLLETMNLEEKVGQLFMPSLFARGDAEMLERMRRYTDDLKVGGVVLLKGDIQGAAALSEVGIGARVPLFMAIDAEWGLGMRLTDAPGFPRNGRISPDADESLLFDYGREVARECRRVGIGMVLGPVLDVAENPGGVIGSRSFGDDPERVASLGVAYARGLESGGVISVAKHFPGHGSPQADSHRELPVIGRSLMQLDSIDLQPFRRYIDAGLTGVMAGHLAVPAIDPERRPAAVSPVVLGTLLRDELGFRGLVLTDALNMVGAEGYSAADAIEAGADIVIGPADTEGEIQGVMESVKEGRISPEAIDEHCRRILFYKSLASIMTPEIYSTDSINEEIGRGAERLRERLER